MIRRIFGIFLLLAALSGCAMAAPELSGVLASDAQLIEGQPGWFFDFSLTEGGTLAMQLLSGDTGEFVADLGAVAVEAGAGRIEWDGLLPDGSGIPTGSYMIAVQMRNFWGEESGSAMISLRLFESEARAAEERLDLSALLLEDAAVWEEAEWDDAPLWTEEPGGAQAGGDLLDEAGVPVATSFWDMNPDAYDLTNPAHQQAIWELMMQPITVFDVGQTEHIYPTTQPNISRTPYETNCTGELHGQSQGVHVLEEDMDGDGYVLIEAYSNDGTKTNNAFMESLDAQLIQGYVKKSLLFEVTPSDKYALLVDKLRQKLYIFEAGAIIGTLDVSTGLNNPSQPYNETPAGEFITVSRVGDFQAGSRTIGAYAIRINGGTLLHEVLYDKAADGTKIYDAYEPLLGQKASHGCIRIQRNKNAQGQNMAWLWENLELKTKVFIWDDKGREMYAPELPDAELQLYRNPNGGSNYHLDANCSGVKSQYLPLTGDFTYGDLMLDEFKKLTPCRYCGAPARPETLLERYLAEAEQIGYEVPEDIEAQFGIR